MGIKFAFITKILSVLITSISPELKEGIREGLDRLDEKAKATKNKFDDLLVLLLKAVID